MCSAQLVPAFPQLDIGRKSKWVQHGPSFPGDQLGSWPGHELSHQMGRIIHVASIKQIMAQKSHKLTGLTTLSYGIVTLPTSPAASYVAAADSQSVHESFQGTDTWREGGRRWREGGRRHDDLMTVVVVRDGSS
ncbi:hypothetical protein C8R45DRAFT_923874 [Mycena sanguinolenta]|nr:hypothetical protein C8R45DRAFT_923874 [Mycena sanguinolenta]